MSNIAVGDVTYTVINQRKMADHRNLNKMKLAFGDGTLTYPAGGIPLSIGNMGCPVVVESLVVFDKGTSGYGFSYDSVNKKLVMSRIGSLSHTHDIKALGGLTSSEALLLDASQNFGKNAATNRTIVGSTSANTGGVVAADPGATTGSEPSAVAIAAQTIYVEVIGY